MRPKKAEILAPCVSLPFPSSTPSLSPDTTPLQSSPLVVYTMYPSVQLHQEVPVSPVVVSPPPQPVAHSPAAAAAAYAQMFNPYQWSPTPTMGPAPISAMVPGYPPMTLCSPYGMYHSGPEVLSYPPAPCYPAFHAMPSSQQGHVYAVPGFHHQAYTDQPSAQYYQRFAAPHQAIQLPYPVGQIGPRPPFMLPATPPGQAATAAPPGQAPHQPMIVQRQAGAGGRMAASVLSSLGKASQGRLSSNAAGDTQAMRSREPSGAPSPSMARTAQYTPSLSRHMPRSSLAEIRTPTSQ
jgi:hypothetical protein